MFQRLSLGTAHLLPNQIGALGGAGGFLGAHAILLWTSHLGLRLRGFLPVIRQQSQVTDCSSGEIFSRFPALDGFPIESRGGDRSQRSAADLPPYAPPRRWSTNFCR